MTGVRTIRELTLDDIDLRIDYFLNASPEALALMGVDPERMPERDAWRDMYVDDFALPLEERQWYGVAWELDGRPVGFSTLSDIEFGSQAYLHLHIVEAGLRTAGHGAVFVPMSAERFFEVFGFQRLFSEPHAFNLAPNRTLQKAGFRYVSTQQNRPGPINTVQTTNLWVLERGVDSSSAAAPPPV